MTPTLYLVPAALGVMVLALAWLPVIWRARLVVVACVFGIAASVAVVVIGPGEAWRSTLSSQVTVLVAVGVAVAWLSGAIKRDWRVAVLVGSAASGLLLFSASQWLVPALMFWTCSSAAIAVILLDAPRRTWALLSLFLSDALVYAATIGTFVRLDTWRLEFVADGWPLWALVGAVVIRCGCVPRLGIWGALGSPADASLPLLVAGAFASLAHFDSAAHPWVAAAVLVCAVGVAVYSSARTTHAVSLIAAWPALFGLAIGLVSPAGRIAAGCAACFAAGAVTLWAGSQRTSPLRGLLLSFLPLTVGGWAVVAAAQASFGRAIGAATAVGALPWTVFEVILPGAAAAGLLLSVRAAAPSGTGGTRGDDAGTAAIALGSVAAALFPRTVVGVGPSSAALLAVAITALVVGIIAGVVFYLRPVPAARGAAPAVPGVIALPRRVVLTLSWAAIALAIAGAAGVTWMTVAGLRAGFLS